MTKHPATVDHSVGRALGGGGIPHPVFAALEEFLPRFEYRHRRALVNGA